MTKTQHAKLNKLQTNATKAKRQVDAAKKKLDTAEGQVKKTSAMAINTEEAFWNYEGEIAEKSIRKMAGVRKR